MPMKKIHLSQKDVNDLVDVLIKKILDSNKSYSVIVSIERGGTHIGKKIARRMEIPHKTVRISHYVGDQFRDEPIIEDNGFRVENYEACLICDDLIDKSHTMKSFVKHFGLREQDSVAVLFKAENAQFEPEFYADIKTKEIEWIDFYWEQPEKKRLLSSL